jgi:hypothetical protein
MYICVFHCWYYEERVRFPRTPTKRQQTIEKSWQWETVDRTGRWHQLCRLDGNINVYFGLQSVTLHLCASCKLVHPLFPLCIINVGVDRQTYLSLPACDMSCVNSTVPEETLPTRTVTIHRNKLGTAMLPTVCYFHINNIRKHKRKIYKHFFVTLLQV